MSSPVHRVRLELKEDEARALHAGLQEALAAELLALDHTVAARNVLARLSTKVPTWLERAPVAGEAGYLIAAEAVLRTLVDGEERGRSAFTEVELAHALGDAKPAGVTIAGVLTRMRRERLLRALPARDGGTPGWSAAPPGRQLLASRGGAASAAEWRVDDADGLAELIFREYLPGREAYRPAVQAIGRLADCRFDQFAGELRAAGILEPAGKDPYRLALPSRGAQHAEQRVRATLPRHSFIWQLPPPPIPYRRGLPMRAERSDRRCSCGTEHAAFLMSSSKTQLHRTLRRDGAVEWECRWCGRRWSTFLLCHLRNGEPAYEAPDQAAFTRPVWRLR